MPIVGRIARAARFGTSVLSDLLDADERSSMTRSSAAPAAGRRTTARATDMNDAAPTRDSYSPTTTAVSLPMPKSSDSERPSILGTLVGRWLSTGAARVNSSPPTTSGSIGIGTVSIPRLAKPVEAPAGFSQRLLNATVDTLLKYPPGLGYRDLRTSAEATKAVNKPLVTSSTNEQPFGELCILRTGGANFCPSPAFLFRAARYANKTVLACSNPGTGAERCLRPLTEYQGVPVPESLRGRLFVVGDPDNRFVQGWQPMSDLFVEQIDELHRSQELLGVDVLESKATVIGHSDSTIDQAITRRRLEEAGLDDVIGQNIALANLLRGESDGLMFTWATLFTAIEAVGGAKDTWRVVPTFGARALEPHADDLDDEIDLSVGGRLGPTPDIDVDLSLHPLRVTHESNARPTMRVGYAVQTLADHLMNTDTDEHAIAAFWNALVDDNPGSDGIATGRSNTAGLDSMMLEGFHDHAQLIEDFDVVDQIVERILD